MRYPTSGNAIPARFTQPYKNLDGSLAPPATPQSANTFIREEHVQRITSLPGAIDKNVTAVFLNHIPECREYVLANGESPANDPIILAAQVCLLRAVNIGQQAEALDISDEDSLQEIELAEAANQSDNTPDNYSALSFETQAAVKIVLDQMSLIVEGGRMCNLIALLRGDVSDMSLNGFSANTFSIGALLGYNSADGDIGLADTDSGQSDTDFSDNTSTIGNLLNPTIPMAGQTSSEATGSSTSGSSGVMGFLTGLVGDASSAASAIKSVSTSATSTGSALSKLVNNLGSGTLSTYVNNNMGTIIGIGIAVLAVIVIAILATKKK